MNQQREVKADACIAIEKDRIAAVGGNEILTEYSASRVIDAGGKVVLPGFISTHSHLFQTMLKGLGRDKDLMGWLDIPFASPPATLPVKLFIMQRFAAALKPSVPAPPPFWTTCITMQSPEWMKK